MLLTFEKFNAETDTEEYLRLVDANMRVIRGASVHFFLRYKEKGQLRKFLKDSVLLTIKVAGALSGFVVYSHKDQSTLRVEQLQLKPQFRGQGIGTRALELVEAKAKELRCTRLDIEVCASNPARRLYERFGFKKVGLFRLVCWWIYRMRKHL